MRALKTEQDFCPPYNKPRCESFKYITKTHQFESSSTKHIYFFKPQHLNCASKDVVCLFSYKTTKNNTQEALKNFRVDLIITDVRIETF